MVNMTQQNNPFFQNNSTKNIEKVNFNLKSLQNLSPENIVNNQINLNNVAEHKLRANYFNNQRNFGHNPITNPIPFNQQNPYLSKELKSITSKNIFTNSANNNIIR